MGKNGVLRAIGLAIVVAVVGWGAVSLVHVLAGPEERNLGPGIVLERDETVVPSSTDPGAQTDGSTKESKPPQDSARVDPSKAETSAPEPTATPTPVPPKASQPPRTQGPVNPLPPATPHYDDDDDDHDDDDDDDNDDDNDD